VLANTIDVDGWIERAGRLVTRRSELRQAIGLDDDDVAVLSVARLVPEKGLDLLIEAAADAGADRLVVVLAGGGPERDALEGLARRLGVRARFLGDVDWERLPEIYVACDVFALLSHSEPWGVVVNEAAACGLPLVLSRAVGAATDLLMDGENGALVEPGDSVGTARALRALQADADGRRAAGARSREIVRGWGYPPSVDAFVAAVEDAVLR
jgi:glycosyltransferase involved in cell wall biosynthesis